MTFSLLCNIKEDILKNVQCFVHTTKVNKGPIVFWTTFLSKCLSNAEHKRRYSYVKQEGEKMMTQYRFCVNHPEESVDHTLPGARASREKHSPVEAMDVTRERRLLKYCDRMVTVGRKVRQ